MKNKKGSVLIWAVVVILIFSVFTAAGLTIAYTMNSRSAKKNTERQLYLSARSATTTVANEITSSNGTVLINEIIKKKPNVLSVNNFFPSDMNMGKCIVQVKCNTAGTQIIVSSIASNDDFTKIVSAAVTKDASGKWIISKYDNKSINESR